MTSVDFVDAPAVRPEAAYDEETHVVELVRRAGAAVDALWRAALDDGHGESALKFGEASQGIHRALIALGPVASLNR